jgi:hypothetical protein
MTFKTLEANSIPIPPYLAGLLKGVLGRGGTGFDEGAFLQQLHYWTVNSNTSGLTIDGIKWIYNSLKAWQEQFPWMSQYGLRKAIANLKKLGLIQTAQHWINQYKRVMFYRIDYDQLNAFAPNLCDLIAPRRVKRDQVEVQDDRTTDTDTSSSTSSEQQTVVVPENDKSLEDNNGLKMPDCEEDSEVEVSKPEGDSFAPASSGNNSKVERPMFPELMDAVARAIAPEPLSSSLRGAITQFPERVRGAIEYLRFQQGRRSIHHPVGYLYEAIVSGWNLSTPSPSVSAPPAGFNEWFDRAKTQSWVVAAMTIDGVHHTLHTQQGWVPTEQLMQKYGTNP